MLLRTSDSDKKASKSRSSVKEAKSPAKAAKKFKSPKKATTRAGRVKRAQAVVEEPEEADAGHSKRWNKFVGQALSTIINKAPNALPGIGPAYATHWQEFGCNTADDVVGCFLKEGAEVFKSICSDEIGMSSSHTHELLSGLESRWNTLAMVGGDIDDLSKVKVAVGDHSSRWGPFVNAKMSGLRMSDVPGVGPTFLGKLKSAGFETPTELMGEFILLGAEDFTKFITEEIGIRNVGANKNPYEVASAFEAKWNALTLVGAQ